MKYHWRVNLVFILLILFSAAILSRLIYIQVVRGDFYRALAQGLSLLPNNEAQPERGEIFLKKEEPLAVNRDFTLVFASPEKVIESEKTAEILSKTLNLDKNFILDAFKKDTLFSPIKYKLTSEEITALKDLNLDGIYLVKERGRYYPQETLASQLIGFLGAEGAGQYGLEEYYDEILSDEGRGSDLILTIDYGVQFQAEKLLEEAKKNLDIEGGQIIVIEPNSGKICTVTH